MPSTSTTMKTKGRRIPKAGAVLGVALTLVGAGAGVRAWLRHKARRLRAATLDRVVGDVPYLPDALRKIKRRGEDWL